MGCTTQEITMRAESDVLSALYIGRTKQGSVPAVSVSRAEQRGLDVVRDALCGDKAKSVRFQTTYSQAS